MQPLPLNKVGYTDALITGMNIHVIWLPFWLLFSWCEVTLLMHQNVSFGTLTWSLLVGNLYKPCNLSLFIKLFAKDTSFQKNDLLSCTLYHKTRTHGSPLRTTVFPYLELKICTSYILQDDTLYIPYQYFQPYEAGSHGDQEGSSVFHSYSVVEHLSYHISSET